MQEVMTLECIVTFIPFTGGEPVEKYICMEAEGKEEAIKRINNAQATVNGHLYTFKEWL